MNRALRIVILCFLLLHSSALADIAVHFIDVGQADAALVICDGEAMLIDGGNVADSSLVVAYLAAQGVGHLEYMICTHAHEDHVGGLSGPLNTCTVDRVLCSVDAYDTKAFASFEKYVDKQRLEIEIPVPGDVLTLGGSEVTILGPVRQYESVNDQSIVLRIAYGEVSFLFTGDAEWDAEHDILDAGDALESDVLKVGHHGSDTSSSYVWLRAVMPKYAVISVGADNSYGHPSEDVLSRLRDAGAQVLRTDQMGHIVVWSDGVELQVKQVTHDVIP